MADAVTVPPTAIAAAVEAAKAPADISLAGYAMLALGVIILVTLAWIFVAAQLSDKSRIDMSDLVLDPATGRMTQAKWHGLIAGAAGTWVFIYLAVSGHFDPTYAAAYLVAMMAAKVAGDITSKPADAAASPPPGGQETTTERTVVRTAADPAALLDAARGVVPCARKRRKSHAGKKAAARRR